MKSVYLVVLALFLGIIAGMLTTNDLTVPTTGGPDQAYFHGIKGKDQVSLTINVDWGGEYIPGMLDCFSDYDIKVTFFVTGKWAEKNPELLSKMAEEHEIGNHGYSHLHPKQLSRNGLIDLIKKNEEIIKGITGQTPHHFAPPYGEQDQRIVSIASSIGYKTIMWSADTIDWQRPAPEIIEQRAVNKIDDGGIILMHPTEPSLAALPQIISRIQERGFKFVTVSQLITP